MVTGGGDVLDALRGDPRILGHDLQIASPPCQSFSVSGNGQGRQALNTVVAAINRMAYWADDLEEVRATLFNLINFTDPRTGLVLVPLVYVMHAQPTYIAWEQVPAVLPVWEACAPVLESFGYSVATGVLNAEQYGVPQTRKRAFLVARSDGQPATLPTPTHSKYHPRDPHRLDPVVKPWVSLGDALGWHDDVELVSNYGTGGDPRNRGTRSLDQPAPTITSKADRMKWGPTDAPAPTVAGGPRLPKRGYRKGTDRQMDGALNLTQQEAAVLQTYPADFPFQGNKGDVFLQIGNAVPPLLAEAVLSNLLAKDH